MKKLILNREKMVKIILNKDRFLEVISEINKIEDTKEFKKRIGEILESINLKNDIFFLLNISENGDTIEYQREVLLSDLQQMRESKTLERAKYYLERLRKGIEIIKTSKINDLNLNRWKEYGDITTDSLWYWEKRDNSGVHIASYWGNFIPQIPNQTMRR